ncbi:MAG: hypothetical protein NOU37_07060 [Candidatus Brocadiales bacterium]|nr:hypothetical protein [Candidatus Bathyanammoxibius amoris]
MRFFLIALIVPLVICFSSCGKQLTPEEYWAKEVKDLEAQVAFSESLMQDAALELKKKKITLNLDMAQQVNFYISLGYSPKKAREEATQTIREEIEEITMLLEFWNEMWKEDKKSLLHAKQQLAKYRRTLSELANTPASSKEKPPSLESLYPDAFKEKDGTSK